jgi:GBP family porin
METLMKKAFLPLMAMSLVCGAAHGQSTVTVYGMMDLGFVKSTGSTLQETYNKQDRLGFMGTEDLGNGLKAKFQLESRFSADTGALASALLWHGESWVGLAGPIGEVRFGRQYTPVFRQGGMRVDPFNAEGIATTANSYIVGAPRDNNAINYITPLIGGFVLTAQYALSEITTGLARQNGYGGSLTYDMGPLSANLSYDKSVGSDAYYGHIGAGYVFGPAKVTVGYVRGETKVAGTGTTKGVQVGLNYIVASGNIKATYSTLENANGELRKQFGGGYEYYFTKRTNLYAYVNRERHISVTSTQLGILHRF